MARRVRPVSHTVRGCAGIGLGARGGVADALITIDEAPERCEGTGEGWALAELHRVRGKTLLSGGASGANQSAEVAFLTVVGYRTRTEGSILGTARRHEPCPAVARSRPFR